MNSYLQARQNMVVNQIMPMGVHDTYILGALKEVPKHQFLDTQWQSVAYSDAKLPISGTRSMIKPEEFAKMLQALELDGEGRVLDIACGTGYSTAVLSKLSSQALGIESDIELATKATNALAHQKINNAVIKTGDILAGDHKNAPYDAILVNVCLNQEPKLLLDQLTMFGRLVCAIETANGIRKTYVYQNLGDTFSKNEVCDSTIEKI